MSTPDAAFHRGELNTGSTRRADIQGLRGLAVALVVLYHMGLPVPGGYTGVDMFFVVSGYVIMESLLREHTASGQVRFSLFFLRRFKRLFPALLVLVASTVVLSLVFLPPLSDTNTTLVTGIGAIFVSANVVIELGQGNYFAADTRLNPLLHTWSLSVEEQFYLFFPLVFIVGLGLGRHMGGHRRGLILAIGAVTTLSFILALVGIRVDLPIENGLLSFYSPIPRAWEFGVGALLSLFVREWPRRPGRFAVGVSGVTGIVMVGIGAFVVTSRTPFPSEWTVLPVIGTAMIIWAGSAERSSVVQRVLSVKPIVRLGDVSYSLYLWHWPLIVFAGIGWGPGLLVSTAAVALSLFLASLSYRFVETPLRSAPTESARSVVRYVAVVLGVPGIIIATSAVAENQVVRPYVSEIAGQPFQTTWAEKFDCLGQGGFDQRWANRCSVNSHASGEPIYLIGDSTAAQLADGLVLATEQTGRPLSVWTAALCLPLSNLVMVTTEDGLPEPAHCREYVDFVDSKLQTAPPGTVILAFSDATQWRSWISYQATGQSAVSSVEEKALVMGVELERQISHMRESGHDVLVVFPIPNFTALGVEYRPRACSLWQLGGDSCAPRVPAQNIEDAQAQWKVSMAKASARAGAKTFDFSGDFCDETTCSPSRKGILAYRDDLHITAGESERIGPIIVNLFLGDHPRFSVASQKVQHPAD